jgi:hypothetical protein
MYSKDIATRRIYLFEDGEIVEIAEKKFGIHVHIHTRCEHGNFDKENTNPHVQIESLDNKKICKVNIAGECPSTVEDMRKCVFDVAGKKMPSGILSKILNWANYVQTVRRVGTKNWDHTRLMWVKRVEEVEKNKNGENCEKK